MSVVLVSLVVLVGECVAVSAIALPAGAAAARHKQATSVAVTTASKKSTDASGTRAVGKPPVMLLVGPQACV